MEMSDSGNAIGEKTEHADAQYDINDTPSSPGTLNSPDVSSSVGKDAIESLSEDAKFDTGPPNGGLKAWLQVAASFFLFFNTWYANALVQHTSNNFS